MCHAGKRLPYGLIARLSTESSPETRGFRRQTTPHPVRAGSLRGTADSRILVPMLATQRIMAVGIAVEKAGNRGMIDHLIAIITNEILLAYISDVAAFVVLGEEMIKGLILGGPKILGDRFIPFFAVCEDRIDVEDDAAKLEQPVPHHLAYGEAGMADRVAERCRERDSGCSRIGDILVYHQINVGI